MDRSLQSAAPGRGRRPGRGIGRRKRAGRDTRKALPFLLLSMTGVAVFALFPFFDAVGRTKGLAVYREVLANRAFRLAAGNTARFMGTALPLLMAVSFFLALLVSRSCKKSRFFKTVLVLPAAVPAAGVALLWKMVFCGDGIVNRLAGLSVDWIHGPESFAVLVFAYLWKNTGYLPFEYVRKEKTLNFSAFPDFIPVQTPKILPRFPGLQIQFLNHIPGLPQSAEALIP